MQTQTFNSAQRAAKLRSLVALYNSNDAQIETLRAEFLALQAQRDKLDKSKSLDKILTKQRDGVAALSQEFIDRGLTREAKSVFGGRVLLESATPEYKERVKQLKEALKQQHPEFAEWETVWARQSELGFKPYYSPDSLSMKKDLIGYEPCYNLSGALGDKRKRIVNRIYRRICCAISEDHDNIFEDDPETHQRVWEYTDGSHADLLDAAQKCIEAYEKI